MILAINVAIKKIADYFMILKRKFSRKEASVGMSKTRDDNSEEDPREMIQSVLGQTLVEVYNLQVPENDDDFKTLMTVMGANNKYLFRTKESLLKETRLTSEEFDTAVERNKTEILSKLSLANGKRMFVARVKILRIDFDFINLIYKLYE